MSKWVAKLLGRILPLIPGISVSLVPFLIFYQVWATPDTEAKYFFGDTNGLYWPDLIFLKHAISELFLPLWNPYDRGGYPYCADPESGVLYPINWLLALLGHLLGELPFWLMQAKVFFHLCIAGLGMYSFLRLRGLGAIAAVSGGVVFLLGPYMMHNAHFALIWPVAWLPWVLCATDKLIEHGTFKEAFVWASLVGLICVAGSPPGMFYSALVSGAYLVFRCFDRGFLKRLKTQPKRYSMIFGVAFILAVVFALPITLSGVILTDHSRLAHRGFGYVASGSISFNSLLGLILRSGSRLYYYAGILSFVFAAYAFLDKKLRKDVIFFGVLAFMGVVLALGKNTPILRIVSEIVPGMSMFRLAFRYLFLLNVGLAVLCGIGVDALASSNTKVRVLNRTLAIVGLLLGLFIFVESTSFSQTRKAELLSVLLLLMLSWIIICISRRWTQARVLLIFLLLFELGTAVMKANTLRRGRFQTSELLSEAQIDWLRDKTTAYRIYDEFAIRWRGGTRYAIRDFRGYMHPLVLGRYHWIINRVPKHPELLALFNVKYLLHAPHPYHRLNHNRIKKPKRIENIKSISRHIYMLPNPTPFAYWVGNARLYSNDKMVRQHLHKIDSKHEVALAKRDLSDSQNSDLKGRAVTSHARVEARLKEWNPNRISLVVTAPYDGFLVVNEAWFPGWRASVDGQPREILRANSLVQAVRVMAGRHVVEFYFRPSYFIIPSLFAFLCLIAAGLYLAYSKLRFALMKSA